jgi:DNA-binding beta-propeller fold protein YncE
MWMRALLKVLVVLLFSLSACGQPSRRPEPDNLFWPLPPEKPRIKYVQSIYSEDDIGFVYSFKQILFGKAYMDRIGRPYGVFARNQKVYVGDLAAMRVLVFDLAQKRLRVAGDEGAVQIPAGVIADSSGTIYVADAGQAKIAVYDRNGVYVTAFPLPGVKPVALALNEALGRLYVLDRIGHRVVVLNLAGGHLFEFGGQGKENGKLHMPLGIALDKSGKVYVMDTGNFRVQIFDPDGKFLHKFGSVGDRAGFFASPKGIAVDSDGHIYVTDAAFSNFQIFDRKGNILLYVGRLGSYPGQLYLPAGISIDENDRIYIADQFNNRVQVFQYLKDGGD